VRHRNFTQQLTALQRLEDPDLARQIDHYRELLGRLESLLEGARQQIAPGYAWAKPAIQMRQDP
jgi:hypothetical protein